MKARMRKRGGEGNIFGGQGSKGGKLAVGSVVATLVGAVVQDLRKPDSLIRGLISTAREKFLIHRDSRKKIDIGDKVKVEFIDEESADLDSPN